MIYIIFELLRKIIGGSLTSDAIIAALVGTSIGITIYLQKDMHKELRRLNNSLTREIRDVESRLTKDIHRLEVKMTEHTVRHR
ncbi:TPA: hypothetical protein HA265_00365 [Candidatus Woesearchaeota archaeon]|nr:hypothetical protein [Candidatus Woesearchaeota archaeon]